MSDRQLHEVLRSKFPKAKQNTLRRMLQRDRVRVNGQVIKNWHYVITDRDQVVVTEPIEQRHFDGNPVAPMEIIHEDAHLLVIHKPAGLLTSTVPREKRPTAFAILKRYLADAEPRAGLGLIHRLDRDASGLLVFSKDLPTYDSLKTQFFRHHVRRVYVAAVHGVATPAAGRIISFLSEAADGSVRSTKRPGAGQKAVTDYLTIAREKGRSAIQVTLQTGRKHQIRAHLSERGVPIIGDPMYGKPDDDAPRMMLAAVLLGFKHPATGEEVLLQTPVPEAFPIVAGKTLDEITGASKS